MGMWSEFRIACVLMVFAALLMLLGGAHLAWADGGTLAVADGITLPYPDGWSVAPPPYANVQELMNAAPSALANMSFAEAKVSAHILVSTERRTNHAEAVSRLQELATDSASTPTFLKICGWPALQRRAMVTQPGRGDGDSDRGETEEVLLRLVTAVAVDSVMVRIDGSLMPDSAPAIADQVEAIARGLVCKTQGDPAQVDSEINQLRSKWSSQSPQGLIEQVYRFAASLLTPSPAYGALPPRRLPIATEMEVAVSSDGKDIVVCGQNTFRTSNDGGVTFPFGGFMPLTTDGDCSLAVGQSGNFYGANLVDGSGTGVLFDRSTDNGHSFINLSRADPCPDSKNCSPDQEHIAADRVTAGTPGDQVYVVWRNFNTSGQDPALVCSQDGVNWTAPIDVEVGGFVPRIAMGQDGFVYVIYRAGNNIRIAKYSSCANGLALQMGFPNTVHAVTDVACASSSPSAAVPGLDRCNDGNILSSHMAAVDDTNPNHIYVSYATNTANDGTGAGTTNENVMVIDSTDGGKTWGTPVQISAATTGRRFMPWICPLGGVARVAWYDRRAAVAAGAATDDLTDYYCGSASPSGGGLAAGTEIKVTDSPDPECAAGQVPGSAASWPNFVRSKNDSETCSVQPQLAGHCCTGSPCTGSQQACDFSSTVCPSGETCNGGGGVPKYGDYNGNACGAGRVFIAWASAVPPTGITASGNIDVFVTSKLADGAPDLSITKTDSPDPVVAGTTLTYTITVTNSATATALNVTVKDTIPANTTFLSATSSTFSCSGVLVGGTGTLTCTNAFLAQNEVDTITLMVNVDPATPKGTMLSNTATVSSDDTDPTPGNNSATQKTLVDTQADLAVTKLEFPHPLLISSEDIHYTITVTNAGPSNATNFVLSDPTPTHTTFRSVVSPAGFTCTTPPVGNAGLIKCTHPSLPLGTFTFNVVVRLDQDTLRGTTITDTATVTSDTFDPTLPDNTASASVIFAVLAPALSRAALLACGLLLMAAGMRLRSKGRLLG